MYFVMIYLSSTLPWVVSASETDSPSGSPIFISLDLRSVPPAVSLPHFPLLSISPNSLLSGRPVVFSFCHCGLRFLGLTSAVQSAAWGIVGHIPHLVTLPGGSWNYPLWVPHCLCSPSSNAASCLPDPQTLVCSGHPLPCPCSLPPNFRSVA